MLDKSVPYYEIIMKRPAGLPLEQYSLAKDYRFVFYQPGDEKFWAKIETAVLEFDDEDNALAYFSKTFLPYPRELEERMLFVENKDGEKIATCTAWWTYTNGQRNPLLHWLSVLPSEQGSGIGTALTAEITRLLQKLENDQPIYLSTQTWSHSAIGIYEKLGYTFTQESLGKHKNDKFAEAMAVLKKIHSKTP